MAFEKTSVSVTGVDIHGSFAESECLVKITRTRGGAYYPADLSDMPADMREALLAWLTT